MSLPPLTLNAWLRYALIGRHLRSLGDVRSVLEVGAGEGALGARLARRYSYLGVEMDPHSAAKASARLSPGERAGAMLASLDAVPAGATFDIVCAFEVLEHIEDDAGALAAWRERIRPGGWLLLSVPAFQRRFGAADRRVGHFRRYERAQLDRLLRAAGYADVDVRIYGFPLGYALEGVRNLIAARREAAASMVERSSSSGRWLQPPDALGWLTRLATLPFRLLQRPFERSGLGTGFVVLARRPA